MTKMDFQNKLILIYFNSEEHDYNPFEIMKLLKVNYKGFYERLDCLIKEGYLKKVKANIEISELGINYLYQNYLSNVNLLSLVSETNTKLDRVKEESKEIVYIPKDFHKKLK
ncbi:hypothetical protein ACUTSK_20940 [Bacillus sp. NA_165.1]